MTIVKDKKSIKYFIVAGIILLCLYSSGIADLFKPIFDDIYYGNLVKVFTSVSSAIIWGLEIWAIVFVCKKLDINLFTPKQAKGKQLQTWQVMLLFVMTILPMIVISGSIGWKIKIVHTLGERITLMGLLGNASEMLAYAVRMVLMIMFISSIQQGLEMIVKTKYVIPFGGIVALLTFGLIDFFVLAVDLRAFYLIVSLWYGVVYLVSGRKFAITWILCYLIYLL